MVKVEEVGMYYSIGADSDISEELERVAVPDLGEYLVKMGLAKGNAKLAAILNKWYCKANGGDPLSFEDILLLPEGDLEKLQEKVINALVEGRKQEVKTKKSKNAETAHAK